MWEDICIIQDSLNIFDTSKLNIFDTSKDITYKLINYDEESSYYLYRCKMLNKYKIVSHKKGIEMVFKVYDYKNDEVKIC